MYHLVCPIKYRRVVITKDVEATLVRTCAEIAARYELQFIEIGTDGDHVHFLIQSVPTLSPSVMAQTIKSITAKMIFHVHPDITRRLWGGHFWTSGFYVNTVGQYANEQVIQNYVKNQGKVYRQFSRNQLTLFDGFQ